MEKQRPKQTYKNTNYRGPEEGRGFADVAYLWTGSALDGNTDLLFFFSPFLRAHGVKNLI